MTPTIRHTEQPEDTPTFSLELIPYHAAIRDLLKRSEAEVWNWFAARRMSPQAAEEVRFDLLKSTYRIERETQPDLYDSAQYVAARLGIDAPLFLYQGQDTGGMNAYLAFVPGEIHLVLQGPLTAQLTPLELQGILAHELAHYLLWSEWDGELQLTFDVLQALITDPHAHPAHFASWRLYRLYSEIFCDRAALAITGDMRAVVSALVKVTTGVKEVHAESFLRQAEEIFAREDARTDGITHPEAYIRARAVKLWAEKHPERHILITRMIEGRPTMDELDLLEQERLAALTRRVLDVLLWRKWFQTAPVVAHARLFFDDYQPPSDPITDPQVAELVRAASESVRDYFCFILLDFVAADRELDEPPLAAALLLAEEFHIKPRFVELVRQELKVRKTQLEKVDAKKDTILAEADRAVA